MISVPTSSMTQCRGWAQKEEIQRLVKIVGSEGQAMFDKACPWKNGTDK